MTLTDLAERVGITIENLSILKTNKAKAIRFSTLDGLCRALDCQPRDLLEHLDTDDDPAAGDDSEISQMDRSRR